MSMTEQPFADAGVATVATKAMYYGAGGAAAGSFLLDNFIGVIGLVIALAGFLVSWWYKHKAHLRAEQEHKAKLESIDGAPARKR
jgi:hypothetical protein